MSSAFSRTLSPPWLLNPLPSGNIPQSTSPPLHLSLPTIRYPGDGLDCRIPVMSVPAQEIIDLTSDPSSPRGMQMYPHSPYVPQPNTVRHSRPARLMRDVISIDDLDDPVGMEPNDARSGSPDIELLFARSRPPSARPRPPPVDPETQPSVRRFGRPVVDLELDNLEDMGNEDLADWRNRFQPVAQSLVSHGPGTLRTEFARFRGFYRGNRHQLPHGHLSHHEPDRNDDVMFMAAVPQIELPGHLDFVRQGFPMAPVLQPQPPPPPPTYEAPPAPRLGYSRSPKEDDVLICPNCEDELGVGKTDIKKQVWVAKKCGHVSLTANALTCRVAHIRNRCIAVNVQNIGRLLPNPRSREQGSLNPSQNVRLRTVAIKSSILGVFFRCTYDFQSTEEAHMHSAWRSVYKGAVD